MTKQSAFESPQRRRTLFLIALISTVIAILVHGYLLTQHFQLKFGAVEGKSLCDISSTFNCSAVAASRFAEFLGVPMALWGIAANLVLLGLMLWYPMVEDQKKASARNGVLFVSGAIAAASVVMGLISLIALSKYCLFCIAAYILSFVTFAALWKGLQAPATVGARFSVMDLKAPLILTAVAFIGSFIANDQMKSSYGSGDLTRLAQERVSEWNASPSQELKTVDPLVFGPPAAEAKMTIVEFADFRCIHCKHAAPSLKAFVHAHPDVRLEFQAWPLDGECNTAISQANGASCLLARAVWCAEQKGKTGWAAHDYIFGQELYPTAGAVQAALPQIAQAAQVPPETMKQCTDSDEAKDAIRRMAQVGTSLNLRGTPTIYVNGKVLPAGQAIPVLTEAYRSLQK